MQAPADIWSRIAADLAPSPRPVAAPWLPRLAAACVLTTAALGVILWEWPGGDDWEVERPGGTIGMDVGDIVETGPSSGARIIVGDIGTVDVAASTRVRLGPARSDEFRLVLSRGTLSARIAAPPRVFFVETPASTVVDLGCAYTVSVDEEGTGVLEVTEGWASLEWDGRESLVPAGARSRIEAGVGPGTPHFTDAPPPLVDALARFDFGGGGRDSLAAVLREARVRDTLTLWHLLSRVAATDRSQVYDRIAELVPTPDGLSRDRVMSLDRPALRFWLEELAWKW